MLLLCFLGIPAAGVYAQTEGDRERPDWIPVGSVPPQVEYRALTTAIRLRTDSPAQQRQALHEIQTDIQRYGRGAMRTAASPLVADLVLNRGERVMTEIRLAAYDTLAELGGVVARRSLRLSLEREADGSARAHVAYLLATTPSDSPGADFRAISNALARAVDVGNRVDEVRRLMPAARTAARKAWNPEYSSLLEALVRIADGPYSSSTRDLAISFLKELADR